jgi:hypothetical protein
MKEYARTIADELRTWQDAATGDADALDAVRDQWQPEDADQMPSVLDYLEAVALEVITWRTAGTAYRPSEFRVEVLRTYGGPGCRIDWDSRTPDYFAIHAYHGTDEARTNVYAPTFGDQMEVYQ